MMAANLARLSVERYANDPEHRRVAPRLFAGKDPEQLLMALESPDFKLPKKTREIYLYLPYRMMGIFPTVMLFGNLDLSTGKPLRKPLFYPLRPVKQEGNLLRFAGGLKVDLQRGELIEGRGASPLRRLVVASLQKDMSIRVVEQNYHREGRYTLVYLKSYGKAVLMDNETFRSLYVQMFMLGRYDPKLFEPVVLSPYSRIYRVKR